MTTKHLDEARILVFSINEKHKLVCSNSFEQERLNNLYYRAIRRYMRRQRLMSI
jgi:hypothetical protein